MQIDIKYTPEAWKNLPPFTSSVKCHATEVYANGNPKPIAPDTIWCDIFEHMPEGYEII